MGSSERSKGVMTFHIIIKFDDEDKIWLAHCLELDIVATAGTFDKAKSDILSLMGAQISYAFTHDNMHNLYHSAPVAAWKELYECMEGPEERMPIQKYVNENEEVSESVPPDMEFVPPDVITKTCCAA